MAADGGDSSLGALEESSFEFIVKFASSYGRVDSLVQSPGTRVGNCACRLNVYPSGTYSQRNEGNSDSDSDSSSEHSLSAFLEVVPETFWDDSWTFPDVYVSISIKNHSCKDDLTQRATFTFSAEQVERGWHVFVRGNSWMEMLDDGWLSRSDELWFNVVVKGNLSCTQPLKASASSTQKMWATGKFADVIVSTEAGIKHQCHRSILASASPVFDKMFENGCKEANDNEVTLHGVRNEDAYAFLSFLYMHELPSWADHHALLALADMYEIVALSQLCADEIAESLSPSSVVQDLQVLQLHSNNSEVVSSAYKRALDNVRDDKKLLREFSGHLLGEQNPVVIEMVFQRILKDDRLLDKVMGGILKKLPDVMTNGPQLKRPRLNS